MNRAFILAAMVALTATFAHAGEAIEGQWKTKSGDTAAIAECGGAYCVTVKTGKYAGRRIGRLSGSQGYYNGEITDPVEEKTYSGSGTVTGDSLRIKGCVMKVFCKSQTWTRL